MKGPQPMSRTIGLSGTVTDCSKHCRNASTSSSRCPFWFQYAYRRARSLGDRSSLGASKSACPPPMARNASLGPRPRVVLPRTASRYGHDRLSRRVEAPQATVVVRRSPRRCTLKTSGHKYRYFARRRKSMSAGEPTHARSRRQGAYVDADAACRYRSGIGNLKMRAAFRPSTFARSSSVSWDMVRSMASAEWGQVPSWWG